MIYLVRVELRYYPKHRASTSGKNLRDFAVEEEVIKIYNCGK